jgi:hypothetical protein
MPCAITEPGNYPNYIKNILKTIEVGNDNDLKACACSLKTPLNNQGCPIIDSNGKIGVFPVCIQDGIPFPSQYLDLSLEELMALFWTVKTWEGKTEGSIFNPSSGSITWSSPFTDLTALSPVHKQEKLVCMGDAQFEFYNFNVNFITKPIYEKPGAYTNGWLFFKFMLSTLVTRNQSTFYPWFITGTNLGALSFYPLDQYKIGAYKITFSNYQFTGDLFSFDNGSASIEIRAKEYWS